MIAHDRAAPLRRPHRARRAVARSIHLIMAAAVGFAVYAPPGIVEPIRPILQFAVIPLATLTGLFLWKQGPIQKFLRPLERARESGKR